MLQIVTIIVMVLTGFGFYFLVDSKIVEPVLNKLLNGPLKSLYIRYIQELTKRVFKTTAEPNPEIAWHVIAFIKVYQMGLPGIPDDQRKQNLAYLKNLSPDPELLNELMDVLPKQTNREFQVNLANFIQDWLEKINIQEQTQHNLLEAKAFSPKTFIGDWSKAFSTWLTGALLAIYFFFSITTFSINGIIAIGILFSFFMSWPVVRLALSGYAKLSSIFTVVAIVLVSLGLHAAAFHTQVNQISANLSDYGYPVDMTIRYPLWLTANDIEHCSPGRSIAVQTEGQSPVKLEFMYDHNYLMAKDDACHVASPEFKTKNFEFYLVPSTPESLLDEETLSITPILLKGKERIDLSELSMQIQLEHPFWNFMYNGAIVIVPTGFGSLIVLGVLMSKRKPE